MKRFLTFLMAAVLTIIFAPMGARAYTVLRVGSHGAEVRRMQTALNAAGYAVTADGIFGKLTRGAVLLFQRSGGLRADGIAGNQTLSLLYGGEEPQGQPENSATARVGTTLRAGSDSRQVRLMQSALNRMPGISLAADGKFGPRTAAAVKEFQARYGLKLTGTADSHTLALLYGAAGTKCDSLNRHAVNASGKPAVIRLAPSSGAAAVATIRPGASVTLLTASGTWYKVGYHAVCGFLPASSLRETGRQSPLVNQAAGFSPESHARTGGKQDDFLGIAFTQLGYRGGKRAVPSPDGMGSGGPYSRYGKYFSDPSEPFCSYFVSWCARVAGIPQSIINNAKDVDGLFYDSQGAFAYFFTPRSAMTQGMKLDPAHRASRSSYIPAPGDLIYFRWSGARASTTFSHIGIVYDVADPYVFTIEGNAAGSVDTRMYRMDDTSIAAYARPHF